MTKLPGLFALKADDPSLRSWAQMVNEHLELWKGSRGDPSERIATQADLAKLGTSTSASPLSATSIASIAQQIATIPSFIDKVKSQTSAATGKSTNLDGVQSELDALSRRVNGLGSAGYSAMFKFGPMVAEDPELAASYGSRWFMTHDAGLAVAGDGNYHTTVADVLMMLASLASGPPGGPYNFIGRMSDPETGGTILVTDRLEHIAGLAAGYLNELFLRMAAAEGTITGHTGRLDDMEARIAALEAAP